MENADPASSGGGGLGELMDLRNANLQLRKERHEREAALRRLTVQLRIREQALARVAATAGKAGLGRMRAEKLRAEDAEKRAARSKSSMDDAEDRGEEQPMEEIVVDAADEQAFAEVPAEDNE